MPPNDRDEKERWKIVDAQTQAVDFQGERSREYHDAIIAKLDHIHERLADKLAELDTAVAMIPDTMLNTIERKMLELRLERHRAREAGVQNEPAPLMPAPARPQSGTFMPPQPADQTKPFSLKHNDGTYVRADALWEILRAAVKYGWPVVLAGASAAITWWHAHGR